MLVKVYKIRKDRNKRALFYKNELRLLAVKTILKGDFSQGFKQLFLEKTLGLKRRTGSIVRIKNFCILTGRSRGIIRFFKLSRNFIKMKGSRGELFGLRSN